jgi:hypothetical protein
MPNGLAETQKDIDIGIYLLPFVRLGNGIIAAGSEVVRYQNN